MRIRLNKKALALIIALAVVMGVGARVGWGYLDTGGTVTAANLSTDAADKNQALVDGVKNGQILYYKATDFKKGRLGLSKMPEYVVVENWISKGDDGNMGSAVSVTRSTVGEALVYSYLENGQIISRDLKSGEELIAPIFHRKTMEDWVDEIWDRTEYGIGSDGQSKSSGTLNGKASVVYELRTNPGGNPGGTVPYELRKRLELVKDDPMLARKSVYEVDAEGTEALVREYTIIEFQLLPAGSTMPSAP